MPNSIQKGYKLFSPESKLSFSQEITNDERGVPSNDNGIDYGSPSKNDDESGATSIEENAHPQGNPENLNHFNENELFVNNDEKINPSGHIDYDDVAETINGEIERCKARLAAKDYSQREGIDYDEPLFPVVKTSPIRCLISVVMKNKWPLWQLDVNNVFLYGGLEENIYMNILKGVLSECGFKQSSNDYYLFVKAIGCVFVALLVYVDDIIISGNDTSEIENIKTFLSSKFQIKDLGKLKYFLGIEVINSGNDICST
ncbi:ribonuclease H-like domain-containing protein [Tanacetum coccineum]